MINLYICGLYELKCYSEHGITDIISIGDKSMGLPNLSQFKDFNLYHFEFDDISHIVRGKSPYLDDIRGMINLYDSFLSTPKDRNILFHCTAGISRSTAAALIFMVRAGYDYKQTYKSLIKMRDIASPNILMISMADYLMDKKGQFLNHVASYDIDKTKWVEQNKDIKFLERV